jgi:hypothetical protein
MPYEEPVPHPALMGHVFEHMFDHVPYPHLDYEEPVPIVWWQGEEEPVPHPDYEEPVPHPHLDYEEPVPHPIGSWWQGEEVDNDVEILNDDELLDIVW